MNINGNVPIIHDRAGRADFIHGAGIDFSFSCTAGDDLRGEPRRWKLFQNIYNHWRQEDCLSTGIRNDQMIISCPKCPRYAGFPQIPNIATCPAFQVEPTSVRGTTLLFPLSHTVIAPGLKHVGFGEREIIRRKRLGVWSLPWSGVG